MNNAHSITKENLLVTLPAVLANDENMAALAQAVADVLASRTNEIGYVSIYAAIDTLSEELLDILAYDFKVDWWDHSYSVEQKRKTLKDSFWVHKHLGTKYAVQTAISAIYPNAAVEEWFQYNGQPGCFRVILPLPEEGLTAAAYQRLKDGIRITKNERSHLDVIDICRETAAEIVTDGYCAMRQIIEIWPEGG